MPDQTVSLPLAQALPSLGGPDGIHRLAMSFLPDLAGASRAARADLGVLYRLALPTDVGGRSGHAAIRFRAPFDIDGAEHIEAPDAFAVGQRFTVRVVAEKRHQDSEGRSRSRPVFDEEAEAWARGLLARRGIGADAVVATAPFYALGGPDEIEANFRAIREEVDLPLFAYDLPVCVHKKLDADMLVRLGSEGVLAGVKDSSGDDVNFRFLVQKNRAAGSPLKLFTGHEVVVDGAFLSGADGVVPGLGNVDPCGYVQQYKAYREGDWEAVVQIQDRLALLMTITSVTEGAVGFGAGVGAFKTALQLLGVFETNQMPRPVRALEGGNVEAVRNVLVAAGMLAR